MTQKLIEGFLKFRKDNYTGADALMPQLVKKGQAPEYFIISCVDSRGNPGTIFRPEPGTFFAHKAMGAIVRPYKKGTALAAALQFALEYNKVRQIIILGHTGCGAVEALIDDIEDEEISSFMEVARAGLNRAKENAGKEDTHDDLHRHAEEQIILLSMENLHSYPSVQKALAEKRLKIRPWMFDMSAGDLLEYSADKKEFTSITKSVQEENKEYA